MSRRRGKKRPQKAEPLRARGGGRLRRAAAILAAVALVGGVLGGALLFRNPWSGEGAAPKTAAIVDQLSLTQPNPDFVEEATTLLEQAGYTVDYFSGEQVTVDFYRNLPAAGYGLIILRVHSGRSNEIDPTTGEKTKMEYVSLFTGEPYDETKYAEDRSPEARHPEAAFARVGRATYYPGAPPLFGISPNFIKYSMRGRFDRTLIMMMGCDGLISDTTAEALVQKGAKAVVGWSGPVSAGHTDAAAERLLEHLVIDRLTPAKAVSQTMSELGTDPEYGTDLRIYPP
jgi:hypothetical protein